MGNSEKVICLKFRIDKRDGDEFPLEAPTNIFGWKGSIGVDATQDEVLNIATTAVAALVKEFFKKSDTTNTPQGENK